MKILVCISKYDYGDPKRGLSSDHYFFYETFRKMGHKIIYFDFDYEFKNLGKKAMNNKLFSIVQKETPDLFFSVLTDHQLQKSTLKRISKTKTVTLNWFCDDTKRFDNYSRYYAPCFNWVITTEPKAIKWYQEIGYHHAILSNWAFNHFLYKPPQRIRYLYDVTFIGQPNKIRLEFVNYLQKHSIKVNCWGHGWENGRINDQKEMYKIFSQSKINLNFTNTFIPKNRVQQLLSILGLFSEPTQMKARLFEVPGSKGFLLTQYTSGIEQYYQPDQEIITFTSKHELKKKINYYLEHETQRKKVLEAGYQRTLKEHTYQDRFQDIFNKIF